jgi:hypothetical protein
MCKFYNFVLNDFERAFGFAVEYYLAKNYHSGRTSGEPRGLGAVMDAFANGKLIEIGVKKMIETISSNEMILDFDMKSIAEVTNEPDIFKVKHNNSERCPNLFVEIKRTTQNDRWIGLSEEQLSSMLKGSNGREIYNVFCSLYSSPVENNLSSADVVGMYLKKISNLSIFSDFSDLNARAKLEFILSVKDLTKFGSHFPQGRVLYETRLFQEIKRIRKKSGELLQNIREVNRYVSFNESLHVPLLNGNRDEIYGNFDIEGSFIHYEKINAKSRPNYIECTEDTIIQNDVFGRFDLSKGSIYSFNLFTVGRDPILKRNNLWISKRRLLQLISIGKIKEPATLLSEIADNI